MKTISPNFTRTVYSCCSDAARFEAAAAFFAVAVFFTVDGFFFAVAIVPPNYFVTEIVLPCSAEGAVTISRPLASLAIL